MTIWRAPAEDDSRAYDPADVSAAGLRNHHVANTAYPLAHERTWGPYRVARGDVAGRALEAWEGIDDLGLYVHVPFCETRCSFCEYTVVKPGESGDDRVREYFDALLSEIHRWSEGMDLGRRRVHGLDIGGGTPSFAPAREIERVLDAVRARVRFAPGSDISIETTPRIAAAEPDKLRAWRAMGIDRASVGIQVVQPDLLRVLEREANGAVEHMRAVENLRAAGFERLNVDLMYGFDGQTPASWEATIAHALSLGPEYVTLYRMRYKLTRISHHAARVHLDAVRTLGTIARAMLLAAGYSANPGKTTYSRVAGDVGTSSYLARRVTDGMPYLGLGLGAQTVTNTTISYNDGAVGKNLLPYLRSVAQGRAPIQDLYDLPARHMMAKMCAVSFYFGEIDHRAFEGRFGVPLRTVFSAEIDWLEARGWMTWNDRALSLTDEGSKHTPGIIPLFYAPGTQRYLLERDGDEHGDARRPRRAEHASSGAPDGRGDPTVPA